VITALIGAAAPARVMEIGTEGGGHTALLLPLCRDAGATLELADIRPDATLSALLAQYPGTYRFHPLGGLQAIPLLPACDVVLIDGDPNWHTVFHELQLLFARAIESGTAPPIVMLHATGWPYGRRDMYRDPGLIPENHPFAQRGIVPGQSRLADFGVEGTKHNALHEGGQMNGVLTAAEDFVASWPKPIALHRLPFAGGLAILVPEARATPGVLEAVAGLFGAESLMRMCDALEQERARLSVDLAKRTLALTQRSEALARARTKLALLAGRGAPAG
jgi:hypothetical protein